MSKSIGVKVWRCNYCKESRRECMGTGAISKCGQVDFNHTFKQMIAYPAPVARAYEGLKSAVRSDLDYRSSKTWDSLCDAYERLGREMEKAKKG